MRPWRHAGLLVQSGLLAFLRDRTAAFFTFLLPVVFIVVLSLVFSDSDAPRIDVRLVGQGVLADALPEVGALEVERAADREAAIDAVRDGDAAAAVIVDGNRVELRYAASDPIRAATARGIVQSIVDAVELQRAGARRTIEVQADQVEDEALSGIDFFVPGILAFAISTSAVIGFGTSFVQWRVNGLLSRLRLAPVSLPGLIGARMVVHLGVALLQTVVLLGIGIVFFDLDLSGNPLSIALVTTLGALAFLALGLATGALARTPDAAAAIGNIITVPMAFLSGVFFPLDAAPGWLQTIGSLMPMHWVAEALRDVAVRDNGLAEALPELGLIVLFTALLGAVCLRFFRWSRE